MDLFEYTAASEGNKTAPLAERMRARTLDEFIGQKHLVGQGSLLRRAISADRLGSCIFYGPPGTGKTTLANIIANNTDSHFEQLNAVSSGVSDAKRVIDEARDRLNMYGKRTYLLLDECHRWNKAQSDSVLAAIEKGYIIFVGSTTENPYVTMTKAIVSRCRVFEFRRLSEEDVVFGMKRAVADKERGLGKYNTEIEEEAYLHIARTTGGDLRSALNAIELGVLTTLPDKDNVIRITREIAAETVQQRVLSVDESMYYDMISAFCKSLRGSDSNAALYWSERLIKAGCDPMLIARRLMVHSAEDVGMADPMALVVAASAVTAYEKLGLPEGKIPLSEAIIYVCEAPKSNSVVTAMYGASAAVDEISVEDVPFHLRDVNYKTEKITGYKYPHDYGGYVEQQYLPDSVKDKVFYRPSGHGFEAEVAERAENRRALARKEK